MANSALTPDVAQLAIERIIYSGEEPEQIFSLLACLERSIVSLRKLGLTSVISVADMTPEDLVH